MGNGLRLSSVNRRFRQCLDKVGKQIVYNIGEYV